MNEKSNIRIVYGYDYVLIYVGSRLYSFNNEDPTLGADSVRVLLEDLGYSVSLEEDY